MKSYREQMAKNTIVLLLLGLLSTALGYLLRVYVAHTFSVEEFGLFYSVLAFIYFFGLFKDLGMGQSVTKLIAEYRAKKSRQKIKTIIKFSIAIQFFVGLTIAIIFFTLSDFIAANFFHSTEAALLVKIMSVEFFIGFSVLRPIMQGFQKIHAYALVEPARIILVFAFLTFFINMGISGVAFSQLASTAVMNAVLFAYVFTIYRDYDREKTDKGTFSELMKFSLAAFSGILAATVITSIDTLMITFFLSLEDVALYNAAMPTSFLLSIFISAIGVTLLPSVSEIWSSGNKEALGRSVSLILKYLLIAIMPFAIIFITFPEIALGMVFGSSYAAAAPLLQILSVSVVLYSLYAIMSITLIGIGHPKTTSKIITTTAVLNFLLNLVLINVVGVVGAAISSLISYAAATLMTYKNLKKHISISFDLSVICKIFAGALISASIIFLAKNALSTYPLLEAVITLAIGFSFYVVFILKSGTIRKADIKLLDEINIKVPKRIIDKLYRLVE